MSRMMGGPPGVMGGVPAGTMTAPGMVEGPGVSAVNDQMIVMDLLSSAKSGVKAYAVALTETYSPAGRSVLRRQLNETLQFHDRIADYMVNRGYYHPYNIQEQIRTDMANAQRLISSMGVHGSI